MSRSYFITATDTGAGKTFVSSSIARALRLKGVDVGVMKPVESGCAEIDGSLVPEDAVALKAASCSADAIEEICPYRLSQPISPHLAARLSGVKIDFEVIKSGYRKLSARHGLMLVEGAGGLLAPLTDDKTVADLVVALRLPVIIAATSKLGVINHTLLTVEAARNRGIEVRAIILNGNSEASDGSMKYNSKEIERITGLRVFDFPRAKKEAPDLTVEGLIACLFQ
ncbi:MAG: dethiobiotin synthase [Deltaproteobacteria bacterium]|nr:dethiobiotin synthase [Deltaproteobacteria bacterium]